MSVSSRVISVDGRNPANQLRLVVYLTIYKFHSSQVVQEFFHHGCMSTKKTMQLKAKRPLLDETSLQSGPGADSLSLGVTTPIHGLKMPVFGGHVCSNLPYLQEVTPKKMILQIQFSQ